MNLQEFEQRILSLGESIYSQEDFYQQASHLLSQTYPSERVPLEPSGFSETELPDAT